MLIDTPYIPNYVPIDVRFSLARIAVAAWWPLLAVRAKKEMLMIRGIRW